MPTVHLTCPKCRGSFDYEYLPGGSFTAVRLGTRRAFRCPLCHRFAVFDVVGAPRVPGATTPAPIRVDDRRPTWVGLVVLVIPVVAAVLGAAFLLPHRTAIEVSAAALVVLAVGAAVVWARGSVVSRGT